MLIVVAVVQTVERRKEKQRKPGRSRSSNSKQPEQKNRLKDNKNFYKEKIPKLEVYILFEEEKKMASKIKLIVVIRSGKIFGKKKYLIEKWRSFNFTGGFFFYLFFSWWMRREIEARKGVGERR